ncbi:MAG: helix-turn-helix transcriptional regulator [Verrucomicrobia bacterium]|nr:helix-turn-helix transcriptional regulator [Verrucomicrobiota bacterium]MCC5850175.1 helix-turn-helix transcriptional regulator [Verrucomicrobiota bacterium]
MKIDDLSTLVVEARKAQGLSQRELSELSGVGESVIYKLESGRGDVTLSSFAAVLSALGFELRCRSPLGGEVSLDR